MKAKIKLTELQKMKIARDFMEEWGFMNMDIKYRFEEEIEPEIKANAKAEKNIKRAKDKIFGIQD